MEEQKTEQPQPEALKCHRCKGEGVIRTRGYFPPLYQEGEMLWTCSHCYGTGKE